MKKTIAGLMMCVLGALHFSAQACPDHDAPKADLKTSAPSTPVPPKS
ncbi:MAG: hypothetical protein ACK4FF_09800 [Limnobacter sp.]